MKAYYLSEKEFDQVFNLVMDSETKTILYHGLIIQAIEIYEEDPEDYHYELMCAYSHEVLSGNYHWYVIPNHNDYK